MKTPQDTQLEQELQELHMVSSGWISDIRFIQDEIKDFKQLIHKTLPRVNDDQVVQVRQLDSTRVRLEEKINRIQGEIMDHLKKIEPLIQNSKQAIELNLIEEHAVLENELSNNLQSFSATKHELFSFVDKVTKPVGQTVFG